MDHCTKSPGLVCICIEKDKTPSHGWNSRSLPPNGMLGRVFTFICICGIRVRDTSITALNNTHLMIRLFFVLNPTPTNPKLLHVKPVNAAASRASSLRLSLIITLAESVSFKPGELAVN